jgi:hypothetical protein
MKPTRAIQFKALLLLIIFSLNSVVGFACSLGVNMGFNAGHHSHDAGHHHEHPEEGDASHHHHAGGDGTRDHHHSAAHEHSNSHDNTALNIVGSGENCCNDFVIAFQSIDKAIVKDGSSVQQRAIVLLSPFILALVSEIINTKGFTQHFRVPPKALDHSPPDIRVFIQSFLI